MPHPYKTFPRLEEWKNDTPSDLKFGRFSGLVPPSRPPKLQEIDNLVELYNKAHRLMSKRNVLFDLKTELGKLEHEFPTGSTSDKAIRALRDVTARELAGITPDAGRYTDVICIGWCVGCNYNPILGRTDDDVRNNPDYAFYSENDERDMKTKCAEMFDAIKEAHAFMPTCASLKDGANDQKTLKIFMAPEFFFRGVRGAYPYKIVDQIIPTMQVQGASALGTKGGHYADWLFIFGTAVGAFLNEDGTAEVQNVALIQKDTEVAIVQKEYVSHIDYKNDEVRVRGKTHPVVAPRGSTDTRLPPSKDRNYKIVTQNDERLSGVRLTFDGIRIALEVCLDHGEGRAAPLAASTQIVLIPSYGMEISQAVCMQDGVIFNVDGRSNGKSAVYVNGPTPGKGWQQMTETHSWGSRSKLEFWGPYKIPY